MKKYQEQGIFKLLDKQITAMAIVKGYVAMRPNMSKLTLSNCFVTPEGKDILMDASVIALDEVKELRAIFPDAWKSSPSAILPKLQRFFYENPEVTMAQVLKGATYWVQEKDEYCGKACNFIYLKPKSGGEISRLLEALDSLKDANMSNFKRKKFNDEEGNEIH